MKHPFSSWGNKASEWKNWCLYCFSSIKKKEKGWSQEGLNNEINCRKILKQVNSMFLLYMIPLNVIGAKQALRFNCGKITPQSLVQIRSPTWYICLKVCKTPAWPGKHMHAYSSWALFLLLITHLSSATGQSTISSWISMPENVYTLLG